MISLLLLLCLTINKQTNDQNIHIIIMKFYHRVILLPKLFFAPLFSHTKQKYTIYVQLKTT